MASKQTKKIPEGPRKAFAAVLRHWIDDKHEGNQTKAAKDLGMSQPHISSLLSGDRNPGLKTLLLLRLETGKTIDEILGFPVTPQADLENRLIASVRMEVARLQHTNTELRQKLPRAVEEEEPAPITEKHAKPAR